MPGFLIVIINPGFLTMTGQKKDVSLSLKNQYFEIEMDAVNGTLSSLVFTDDHHQTNYVINKLQQPELDIDDSRWVGDLIFRYRPKGETQWRNASTGLSDDSRKILQDTTQSPQWISVDYSEDSQHNNGIRDFSLRETFRLENNALCWQIRLKNTTGGALEIGDLGIPLLFNSYYVRDPGITFTQRVLRHHFIEGNGSFIVWMRTNGEPPFLVMTPDEGTHLEYFDRAQKDDNTNADSKVFGAKGAWEGLFTAYIHSAVQGGEIETGGTWRQPHTAITLQPAGQEEDEAVYGFKFHRAKNFGDVKEILYQNGLIDIEVAPGMVIPSDLHAKLALRTTKKIRSIKAEFPGETKIRYLKEKQKDTHIYEVFFFHPGENLLTIHYGKNEQTYLEFFVTEPLETVIKKRAKFIAEKQQFRDPEKWYDGLFSLWDMKSKTLRSPDDTDGLAHYMVGGSDDPSNCKAPYLATKNVYFPDRAEIEAIEYHLEKFVWGGLQRTDKEHPHPYGIYGSDNWFVDRNTLTGIVGRPRVAWIEENFGGYEGTGLGPERMWRTFDYTTMFLLYYKMYQIAKRYPGMVKYLDAKSYLERAFGTAKAYFEVPYSIYMPGPPLWSHKGYSDWAYKQGNFHELVLPDLIKDLAAEGMNAEADYLRGEWEKKVKYMVYDDPYPFGSEMLFDATAFESTHAVAKYGLENEVPPDTNLWTDRNNGRTYSHPQVKREDFRKFMTAEIAANIADRGWLPKTYYHLGSDVRQGGSASYQLSYMTQMGGWSIFDYAIYYADDPAMYLRLGYASYLAGWALVNCGTPENNCGFWFPGKENDGAAGWAFEPQKMSLPWLHRPAPRGIWNYDGEIDHGFIGGMDFAATVVFNDPLFGLMAYGGDISQDADKISVIPKDGISRRLHILHTNPRIHLTLNRDGFAKNCPVMIQHNLAKIQFQLENRTANSHDTELNVKNLPAGRYRIFVNEKRQAVVESQGSESIQFCFRIDQSPQHDIRIEREDIGK